MTREAKQATPREQLLKELMDSRVFKTEREHAAAREIIKLRAAAGQALDALEVWRDSLTDPSAIPGWRFSVVGEKAITALLAALAEEAPPRPTDEDNQQLLVPLENLSRAAYWVVEGGEFWEWVKDKSMPYAAAKELEELAEMMEAAKCAIGEQT